MTINTKKNILLYVILVSLILLLLTSIRVNAQRLNYEKVYQKEFSLIIGGQMEVTLPDRTRVDIVTDTFAIEVDFANKWAEGIGQSLYYGEVLNKKPGILLIIENREKDKKYLDRLMKVAFKHGITVWIIDSNFYWKKIQTTLIYTY